MSITFTDDDLVEPALRRLWHLTLAGRRNWHNRVFSRSQSIAETREGWVVRWGRRPEVRARRVEDLPRLDRGVSILASGPSVRRLDRPVRLFRRPVACVNGSIALACELGVRADYLFVSDYRFILDKPELFRQGLRTADHVILGAVAAFVAMLMVPESLGDAPLYLRDDLLHPFKRSRPSPAALRADRSVIVHPSGELAFRLDVSRGVCPAGTVVYDAMQVLFGTGYREIAMFGVDLSSAPRFYTEDRPAPTDLDESYERRIEPAFELVAEYLRRTGNVLVNGSPESRLPARLVPKADGNRLLETVVAGRPLREAIGEAGHESSRRSTARGRGGFPCDWRSAYRSNGCFRPPFRRSSSWAP
jgi:KDO transferase-3